MRLFEFEPRQLRYFDWKTSLLVVGLALAGVIVIWGSAGAPEGMSFFAKRQLMWAGVGIVIFLACGFLNLKFLAWATIPLYVLTVAAMAGLLLFGMESHGAKSWYEIRVPGASVRIQPSEYAKIATALALAAYLTAWRDSLRRLTGLIVPALIAGIPAALTTLQNDTGTALIFGPIFLAMVFIAGASKRNLAVLFIAAALAVPLTLPLLKDRHIARICGVFGADSRMSAWLIEALNRDPEHILRDARARANYHSTQARIALASGGWFGKGWGNGTQTKLDYVPFYWTDSIFNSLGEQFGFFGCLALLAAYAVLVWRCAKIALDAREMQWSLTVVGLLTIFCVHVFINMGMAIDLLPIIGLPLPFMSYGGSFLLALFIMFGLVVNIGMRKFIY